MSITQLFFSLAGLFITIQIGLVTFFKYYIDAKIDPAQAQLKQLVDYMVSHEGKIASLQERTKNL